MAKWRAIRYLLCSILAVTALLTFLYPGSGNAQTNPLLAGQDPKLAKDMDSLVRDEERSPTTAQNVKERYDHLIAAIRSLVASGYQADVRKILPREEAEQISVMLKNGETETAAGRVHQAILALGALPHAQKMVGEVLHRGEQPKPAPNERYGRQTTSAGSSNDLDALISEERASPTTSQNVSERYERLMKVIRSLAESGRQADVRRTLPREEAEAINNLLQKGRNDEAAASVRAAIDKLSGLGVHAAVPAAGLVELQVLNLHQLATGSQFGNILKLFNPVINERKRELYVVGSRTTMVGVIDLTSDRLVRTFDSGVPGGFLIFNAGSLYAYDFGAGRCYQIDPALGKTRDVPISECEARLPGDKDRPKRWRNYSFLMTGYTFIPNSRPGFSVEWRQDLNAAYGVIEIYDAANNKRGEILTGPDALYFIIDDTTGKLYTTNTGDGSLSVFDLTLLESTDFCKDNRCKLKEINVGTSADQVIEDSAGRLYARNRLGGSTIFKYDPSSKSYTIIGNENHVPGGIALWPTAMELSNDEKRLYVLSHYGALIDVINTENNKVVDKIKFSTSLKPRTDSISTMAIDKTSELLYAVWPETGIIGVANGSSGRPLGSIDLVKYGFRKSAAVNAGPGLINLAVNEKTGTLFVYLFDEQKMLAFNGKTLALQQEAALSMERKREMSLFCNADKDVLYLGNRIINASTLRETGRYAKGHAVIGFDNKRNNVYLVENTPAENQTGRRETIYELTDGSVTRVWPLDRIGSINSRFFFNFDKGYFYVAYFESGMIKKYAL
jgi:DNA-binding beta-propeller fold protein YncE